MLEKTRGIVLSKIKYTDSGIIARVYTRKFGRQSLIIKGMRKRKAGKHTVLLQPMFILDVVMYYKESREMQILKEFSAAFTSYDIYSNVKKSCVAIFLGEILTSVLKEESPNEEMFDYIEESIVYFNSSTENFANFHIAFLAGLSSFLGFEPNMQTNPENLFFDMTNGKFVPTPPVHGNYANEEVSGILAEFFRTSYGQISKIALSGIQRNEVLDTIVKYFSHHLPSLKKINSLAVLKEVFG